MFVSVFPFHVCVFPKICQFSHSILSTPPRGRLLAVLRGDFSLRSVVRGNRKVHRPLGAAFGDLEGACFAFGGSVAKENQVDHEQHNEPGVQDARAQRLRSSASS